MPRLIHGHNRKGQESLTHASWAAMLRRVRHRKGYAHVRVCRRWMKFENFLADMGERPSAKLTLDRIDNNGHYEPGNCRWADRKTQIRNSRSVRSLTAFGKTQLIVEWAEQLGLKSYVIRLRLRAGWDAERSLSKIRQSKKKERVTCQ